MGKGRREKKRGLPSPSSSSDKAKALSAAPPPRRRKQDMQKSGEKRAGKRGEKEERPFIHACVQWKIISYKVNLYLY